MTRRICLAICVIQTAILLSLLSAPYLGVLGVVPQETLERTFKMLSILFVLLSPFGVLSLFMSLGFVIMMKLQTTRSRLEKMTDSNKLRMKIVWQELRNDFYKDMENGRK